jgi:isoquinoline 1-oxidoreductase subunit beta
VRKVVAVGDSAVAVVADTWWQAKTALDALKIDWDLGPNAGASSAETSRRCCARASTPRKPSRATRRATSTRRSTAAKKVEATYSRAAPAPRHDGADERDRALERRSTRVEVWCPTQNGESALATAAAGFRPAAGACDVYRIDLGGGFGRRAPATTTCARR